MKKYLIILLSFALTFFGPLTSNFPANYCFAQDSTAEILKNSGCDGPYIFLQNDSKGIVFYNYNGFFESREFEFKDTLAFQGFCADSNEFYSVFEGEYQAEPDSITGVEKILAVSDIHGRYELLVHILRKSGVIDENNHWIWGNGHLVINGDIFDRGAFVTECLWLIYRLEQESVRAGGGVHFLLGNHELMILRADNRYVNEKYSDGIVRITAIEYQDLYGRLTPLGRWLRSKNAAVKINDILFVHGGISPSLIKENLTISDINIASRKYIDIKKSNSSFLPLGKFLYGSEGPFWYRGYFYDMDDEYSRASSEEIEKILRYFDVNSIVVGHTGVDKIDELYDGRIIAMHVTLDAPTTQAFLWQDGNYYRVTYDGEIQPLSEQK